MDAVSLEPWVAIAIAAALAQTLRNSVAQTISGGITATLNSWARFTFCLPFAAIAAVSVSQRTGWPELPPVFFALCLATALTQLLGNVALITAFRSGGFGESIVFHKLEVLLTAIAGAIWFSEWPSASGTAGIVVCAAGVVAINLGRDHASGTRRLVRAFRPSRSGSFALLCAVLLVAASFALKGANSAAVESNESLPLFAAAVQTLFHTTWMEVVLLTGWIAWRQPESFHEVPRHWRRMALIGAASFSASLGWFWAFSLTLVAYVKAVGQIEALIAVALGIRLLGERELLRQLPGILLVVLGIALVLLG